MELAHTAPQLKQLLLSASATSLKLTQNIPNRMQSFFNIHIEFKHALQEQMVIYKPAILLQKLRNIELAEIEWISQNF